MENENGSIAAVALTKDQSSTKTDTVKPNADVAFDGGKTVVADTKKSEELKKMNNLLKDLQEDTDEDLELIVKQTNDTTKPNSTATVTSTSITVNIKQTKIVPDDGKASAEVDVAKSLTETATAAVTSVAEKLDKETKPTKVENQAVEDIEMEEVNSDVEMVDVATKTASLTDDKSPNAEKKATENVSNNEPEHKIDDVEKNISNLFNGEENAAADEKNVDSKTARNASTENVTKNASTEQSKTATDNKLVVNDIKESTKPSDDIAKEANTSANDLVSILGDDKPSDKSITTKVGNSSVDGKDAATRNESKSSSAAKVSNNSKAVEKKPATNAEKTAGSSTTSSVHNSTPIEKRIETSSQNASTISDTTSDQALGDKSTRQEIISSHSSTTSKSADLSANTPTGGASNQTSSSDNLTRYAKANRKINGISDDTDRSTISDATTVSAVGTTTKPSESASTVSSAVSSSSEDNVYNIQIWYDDTELVYVNIEKQDWNKLKDKADTASPEKVSSTGSATSTAEPFTLPTAITSTNSTLSESSSIISSNTLKKTKHVVKGTVNLCQFMIEHFQRVHISLTGVESLDQSLDSSVSGRSRNKGAGITPPSSTPTSTPSGNKRKRASEAEELKSLKKARKETDSRKSLEATANYPEKAVLARWIDKKYYAGRVIEQKPNNKFVVLFEDGAKKVLPEENVVFGHDNILPLENESVHALVKDDTYEPGIVQSVTTKGETVLYTVLCESTTVTVTASDIYLEEDQAKVILSKQSPSLVNNPEPGFSGGINTRKDRRPKRPQYSRQPQWFSESDVSDIIESDSTPTSPVTTALVAVDGVQPELQHTQKEAELVKICYLVEHFGNNVKSVNLDPILGPIVNGTFFRNKCFLLTCTIPIKQPNNSDRQVNNNNVNDLSNKNMTFSTTPFFKDHLKKQIESAGGTIYNNFEDVPKKKYRSCYLLAPFPCTTAKYVQCLAANITTLSHEWVVQCCIQRSVVNKDRYSLPSGWSIIDNSYKRWAVGRGREHRKNVTPFTKTTIILTSHQNDFVLFWSRVCKFAGAKIRIVKSMNDLTATTQGYILMDDEFPPEYQAQAERFSIPIVSTVWVVQSLILGKVCDLAAHPKLTQLYEDDCF